jgi:hypothetical protein
MLGGDRSKALSSLWNEQTKKWCGREMVRKGRWLAWRKSSRELGKTIETIDEIEKKPKIVRSMGDDTSMEEEFLEVENAGAGEKKMEALFAYLTEIRKAEKSKRQKSKILVIVKNAKVAKLLAASYGGTSVKRVTKQDPRVETLRIRPHMSAGIGQIKIVATQWIGYINEKMKEGDLNGSLLAYKSGKIPCLVTTPEALPSLSPQQHTIKIVIVFDFPSTPDKYLYFMSYSTRKVVSLLPVSASTKQICVELVEGVRERGQDVPPFLATMAEGQYNILFVRQWYHLLHHFLLFYLSGVKVENAKVAASRGTVVGYPPPPPPCSSDLCTIACSPFLLFS